MTARELAQLDRIIARVEALQGRCRGERDAYAVDRLDRAKRELLTLWNARKS